MQVEMVYRNGSWLATGKVAAELSLNGCAAMYAIDVQMLGWVRRIWIPSPTAGGITLADGVIGWADALPIILKDRPHGIRCAEIGSFVCFCAGPSVFAVEGGEFLLQKQAILCAERILAAADEATFSVGGRVIVTAAQAKADVAEFMKPNVVANLHFAAGRFWVGMKWKPK